MKKQLQVLFSILAIFTLITVQAQERELIKGEIKVPEDVEVSGISIYNINSLKGTVTDASGKFMLPVKLNDKLSFSSAQYQDFKVVVDKGVIESKRMNITINEAITELEEVLVRPYNLSGDVEVDAKRIKTKDANLTSFDSSEIVAGYNYTAPPDEQSKVENIAMDKSYLSNGLNFANMFKAIFNSYKKNDETLSNKKTEEKLRKMSDDVFFQENLGIKQNNITEFLYYAESKGLNKQMVENANDLDLIQFLIDKSKDFKAQQTD